MNKHIKLLIVEDMEDDALLIIEQFKASGYEVEFLRVWTEEALREALKKEKWDAITSDHNMPNFDSVRALKVVKASGLDLPFIIVSGLIGEMKAVEVMKAGAHDYVVKGSLERLVLATEREIREAKARENLRRTELSQKFLAQANSLLISSLEYETTIEGILKLIVPKFSDCCIIHLFEREEFAAEFYVSHIDKDIERQIIANPPLHMNESLPQSPRLIPLREGSGLEYVEYLLKFKFNCAILAPLILRNKMIGMITFLATATSNKFDELDLALARELGERSSIAIDNARLYRKSLAEIKSRDDFIMLASHELKTPVTSLRLKLQSLIRSLQRSDRERISDEFILESLKFSDRQIFRIIKLIEELLSVSKFATQGVTLNLEKVNLIEAIEHLKTQFAEELKASGSTLEFVQKNNVEGCWDLFRIEQVIENLLSNAILFGQGKPISIVTKVKDDQALLIVEDHGLGIEKKDQSRIFKRFERAVSTLHFGGFGLGLYISQKIIEAHGGTIHVESEIGKGSKFIVQLPLTPESHPR